MVRVIGKAFAGSGFEISFATSPENVLIAFCLGMVLTFAVVLISSWRVSRLNVVRAMRDIPEPDRKGRSVKAYSRSRPRSPGRASSGRVSRRSRWACTCWGSRSSSSGPRSWPACCGCPSGSPSRWQGCSCSGSGSCPSRSRPAGMTGIDLFFISGVMIVLAGVWIIIYNSDLLLGAVVGLFGWLRGMPPVLRAAVSYPMQSRFRTGMTLAMFSLVVFTIVTMSFITAAFGSIFEDTDRLSGGFDVRADAGYAAPIPDMNEALKEKKGVNADDFTAVGTLTGLSVDAKQKDTSRKPQSLFLQGVDGATPRTSATGSSPPSPSTIRRTRCGPRWDREDTAVISSDLAPAGPTVWRCGTSDKALGLLR